MLYIVAIAWLYILLLVAVSSKTVTGGILIFFLAGIMPLTLLFWVAGSFARLKNARRIPGNEHESSDVPANDKTDLNRDQ